MVPVAKTICWLLSDYAQQITGEIVHVDGGFHAVGRTLEPSRSEGLPRSGFPHRTEQVSLGVAQQRRDARPVVVGDPASGAADEDRGLHRVLGARQIGGGRELVGDRDHRRVQFASADVGSTAPVVERLDARAADRDVALAGAPGTPERVGDHDGGPRSRQAAQASA